MITEARAELTSLLRQAGFTVDTDLPTRVVPPCVILTAPTDWITSRDRETLGSPGLLHLAGQVLTGRSATPLADLERLVWRAWEATPYAHSISAPFYGRLGDNTYLTATIRFTIPL